MAVLLWIGITIAMLIVFGATAIGMAVSGLRALANGFELILHGGKAQMETAIWVVTCPETDRLSTIEVSYWAGSPDMHVTDCFNRAHRAHCGQQCVRDSLKMRVLAPHSE